MTVNISAPTIERQKTKFVAKLTSATVIAGLTLVLGADVHAQNLTLLNVSYDPTRELYKDYNAVFAKYWKAKTGQDVTVQQSHGGSGAQSSAVIDGNLLGRPVQEQFTRNEVPQLPIPWPTGNASVAGPRPMLGGLHHERDKQAGHHGA